MDVNIFLAAIKAASTNPLALVAYLATIGIWGLSGTRTRRLNLLLKYIKTLPAKDRLRAVVAEMGQVDIQEGLSPEQYLRSRIITYAFYAFIAACVTLTTVLAISFHQYGTITGNASLWSGQ